MDLTVCWLLISRIPKCLITFTDVMQICAHVRDKFEASDVWWFHVMLGDFCHSTCQMSSRPHWMWRNRNQI